MCAKRRIGPLSPAVFDEQLVNGISSSETAIDAIERVFGYARETP